jgi:TnpA family transposase
MADSTNPILKISEDPNEEELARDWSLSVEDLVEINRCRTPYPKLHFAVQLCCLRKHGSFLDQLRVPLKIINHIHLQIGLELVLIPPDGDLHERTRLEHETRIRSYCGFEFFRKIHVGALEDFLVGLANEGIDRDTLLPRACEYLFDKRVTPPGVTVMLKVIASAYQRAERGIFDEIYERVPADFRTKINGVLEVDPELGASPLVRYRQYPGAPGADHILEYLDRYDELYAMGATRLDLSGIKPEIILQFHSLVSAYDIHRIKRFAEKRRYSMLACFLSEASRSILDYIIEMNDQYLITMCRGSRRAFEKELKIFRKKEKHGVDTVVAAMDELLSDEINESLTVRQWLASQQKIQLSDAVGTLRQLKRLNERGYHDHLKARYSHLRRYFPRFCELPFKAEVGGQAMLAGVQMLRKMNADPALSELSDVISRQFLSEGERKALRDKDGKVPRAFCEILFALAMKGAIRSGQLHLPESRKNVSFWNMIYDSKVWKVDQDRLFIELSLPKASSEILVRLDSEFDKAVSGFAQGLPENRLAKIVDGELKLSRIEGEDERDHSAHGFLQSVLPKVRIEDLLLDVHRRCGFLNAFTPLEGLNTKPSEKHEKILLAALIAHGTNLGISAMGNSAKGITVDEISNTSRWYIRESTIKAANAMIVDYHHRMRLSKSWGDGSSSSSDGQRFGVQKSSLLASFYPRYFGHYDRAVTVYTHTSDQHSVFHTDVISCSVREAVYVLDGLLENSTLLRPTSHFTDTHGYTEHLFALCHLLGFSFMPRIKNISKQRLYSFDPDNNYDDNIKQLFSGRINRALIEEQWEQIVRVIASLKNKTAPAHLIVGRLAQAPNGDRLAEAITQLGRAVKTIFIFQYLTDEPLRRKIQKQLNRGEARHQLAKHLFFANHGEFRDGDYEEMMHKASCLSLLSNAVLVANTAAIDRVIRTHPGAKEVLQAADLARISPLLFHRVIPNGTYHFRG